MYFKRLTLVALITCGIAYLTGFLFDDLYRKRWATIFFDKTNAIVKDSTYHDIILLGDSRVHFGINPYYFDSVTNMDSYNLGYGGADAQEIMMINNVYLMQHPKPQLAILSLNLGGMTKNETLKTRFHALYYLDNDTINKYMNETGFLTGLMKIFPFTKYSFFDEYNRTSLFLKGKEIPVFDHNIYGGFINIHPNKNSEAPDLYNIKRRYDSLWLPSIDHVRNTVSALIKKGITVVIIAPPERKSSIYRGTTFRKLTDSIFSRIAAENNIRYLHFEDDHLYTDEYFVDDVHLNEPGTKLFSVKLADSIKQFYPLLKKAGKEN
ncbi:MAG: hypothetical protein ABIT58_07815 [Ferruginibacter sp.]